MSIHANTKNDIEKILNEEFSPLLLEVNDDSAAHRGHQEALREPKAGHFKVTMVSHVFDGLSHVKRHRMVYQALSELMHSRIHALSLNLRAGNE